MSDVWNFYKDKTPNSAICVLCDKKINRCNNTSRLIDHLKKSHHTNDQVIKVILKKQEINSKQTTLNIRDNSLSTTDYRIHPSDEQINNLIAEFIVLDCQAYNVVENEAFKKLIKIAFPRYHLPGRDFFKKLISDLHEK
jgi:hypothetical protein